MVTADEAGSIPPAIAAGVGGIIATGAAAADSPAWLVVGPPAAGRPDVLAALCCATCAPTLPAVFTALAAAATAPVPIRAEVSAMPVPRPAPLTARLTPDAAAPLPALAPLPGCAAGAPAPDNPAGDPADVEAPEDDAGELAAEDIGRIADPNTDAGLPALPNDEPPAPVDAAGGTADEVPDFPGSP